MKNGINPYIKKFKIDKIIRHRKNYRKNFSPNKETKLIEINDMIVKQTNDIKIRTIRLREKIYETN